MTAAAVKCPLCGSTSTRIAARTEKLIVCACDVCNAQFTVATPPTSARGGGIAG